MKQVYRSKVDSWLLILILVAWGIPLTLIVVNEFSAVKFSIVSFMLIFTLLLLFGIKYTIEGKVLRVHYSFFIASALILTR